MTDDDFFSIVSGTRPTRTIAPADSVVAQSLGWDRPTQTNPSTFYRDFRPTLWTVSEYANNIYNEEAGEHRPLIGERETFLTAVVIFICAELGIIIRSYPGTGKSITADAVWALLPAEIKHRILNLSDKGIWADVDRLMAARYVYFGEWQKAAQNEDVVEIVKDWGEGRTAERSRTDVTQRNEQGGFGKQTTRLTRRPILVTVASADGKDDETLNEQVLRRYPEVATDPSKSQTREVVAMKGRQWDPSEEGILTMTDEEQEQVREHIRMLIDGSPKDAILPGGEPLLLKTIPMDFPISRSITDIFKKMVNGVARFHHYDRLRWSDRKGKEHLIATPADFWMALRIYGHNLMLNCLRVTATGKEILEVMPRLTQRGTNGGYIATSREKLTVKDIRKALQKRGISLERAKVQHELGLLVHNTYLDEDDSTPKRYWRSDSTTRFDNHLSPELMREIVELCKAGAAKYRFSEEYIQRYCTGPIIVTDPLTGIELDILRDAPPVVRRVEVEQDQAEEEEVVVQQAEEPRREEAPTRSNAPAQQGSLYAFRE